MKLDLSVPSALGYFANLVRNDADFSLFETALSLAQDAYPELDMQATTAEMDLLLVRLQRRMAQDAPALLRLQMLNQFFFGELGFSGNVNNYYDPENSFLSGLLRTRRGIPVSLAVLWLELAQGVRLKACGVSFPGHFMLKVDLPMGQAVIDPMTGRSLGEDELRELLRPHLQHNDPAHWNYALDAPLGMYLQAATAREIIARMLRNLKEIYQSEHNWQRLLGVQQRLVILLPGAWAEYRDRGLVYAELGQPAQALSDLELYVQHANGIESARVAGLIRTLRTQTRH